MDKLSWYRQYIQELLTQRAKLRSPSDPVESETIFDTVSDRYQLANVGWKDGSTRIYGCANLPLNRLHSSSSVLSSAATFQGLRPLKGAAMTAS